MMSPTERDKVKKQLEAVFEWAVDHPEFELSFVESLERQLKYRGSLTEKQVAALGNIIHRFKISPEPDEEVPSDAEMKRRFIERNAAQFNRGRAPATKPPGARSG